MKTKGQVGNGVILGIGCILMAFGAVFLLLAYRDGNFGGSNLAVLESFVGTVLMLFGLISLYLGRK